MQLISLNCLWIEYDEGKNKTLSLIVPRNQPLYFEKFVFKVNIHDTYQLNCDVRSSAV